MKLRKALSFILLQLSAITIPLALTTACDNEKENVIFDYTPVVLTLQMPDQAGQEWLKGLFNDAQKREATTLSFRGQTYPLQIAPRPMRYYLPSFQGFQLQSSKDGQLYLTFGELDGADSYNEHFLLRWYDGTSDDIHLYRLVNQTKVEERWRLNGQKITFPIALSK